MPDTPDSIPDLPAPDSTAAEAVAKAAPRKRTRKPAAAKATVSEVAASASVPEALPSADVPVQESGAALVEGVEAAPARPVRKPRVRKAAVVAVPEVEEAPQLVEAPVPTPEVEAEPMAQAVPVEPSVSAASAVEEVAETGRGRRRGRRGGVSRAQEEAVDSSAVGGPSDAAPQISGEFAPAVAAVEGRGRARNAVVVEPDVAEVFASVISGEFDVEPEAEGGEVEAGADKRVLLPDADAPKLHKVLAQSGIGSRRDMEQMIQDGRVSVNGEAAHTGMRISFGDRIAIDGKPVRVRIAPPPPRVIAYHKPVGEVVTLDDPQQRPTVFRKLPRLAQGKWQSVGRLDINTEGLLLFTTSGDLANKLMHPRFGVEREYAVRVLGTLEKDGKEKLLAGVEIEGQVAAFKSIDDGGGEGVNHWYRVVIAEGRNREVRKLFDSVGLTVSRLIRVRYGCVVLPRGLRRGVWVDLAEDDIKALRQLTDASSSPRGDRRQDAARREPRSEARAEPRRERQEPRNGAPRGEARSEPRADRSGDRREARPPRDGAGGGGAAPRRKGPAPERAEGARGTGRAAPRRQREAGDLAPHELREPGDPTRIPNPLQQTYDKRAIQRERVAVRDDDFEDGPIPNPLQQTYDKRFVQGNRDSGLGGRGGKAGKGGGAPRQPDPMQTAVGYIGADAFTRKVGGGGRGGSGGGRRGGR